MVIERVEVQGSVKRYISPVFWLTVPPDKRRSASLKVDGDVVMGELTSSLFNT
jgi:hypothetical protein